MEVPIDKCTVRVRVRDAHEDDVKASTIKEKIKKNKTHVYFI